YLYVLIRISLTVTDLSYVQILQIVDLFLYNTAEYIRSNYMKKKRTPICQRISMPQLNDEYVLELSKVTTSTEIVKNRNMRDHDWYVYDQAIVNNLESDFIDFINDYMDELKETYEDVYLIRN